MQEAKYVDIHCHLLSGADDGAKDLQESVAMLRRAQKENIGKMILTPHQKPGKPCISPDQIKEKKRQLCEVIQQLHIDIELYEGNELFYSHDLCRMLDDKSVCTLAGSRYVLVEFPPPESWPYIRNGIYELLTAGYRPVLAHVERYQAVTDSLERLQELKNIGCFVQVNAGSITGRDGFVLKKISRRLVREGLADFVATDAHREKGERMVAMAGCGAWLKKRCGQEYADRLLFKNAAHILENRELLR